MQDFASFKSFFLPKVINFIFFIMTVGCIAYGMSVISDDIDSAINAVIGLAFILFGPVFSRLYCELLIIPFRIYEKLCIIADDETEEL